jgi:hypothetical protein
VTGRRRPVALRVASRSSPPTRPQVLANRSLALLSLKRGPEALQDAALCVTLKKNFAKGCAHCAPARAARAREQRRAAAGRYYRFGCALEECKMYKECASVFAKVVEMEPGNVEAGGRLLKAR